MDKIVAENLFLIEFLIDKCTVLPSAISKELQPVVGETCVCFKFLDNGPFDVCEEDFSPKQDYQEEGNTRSGKSCLFAMSASQAEDATLEFNVEVCVFKKLTNGMLPDKIQIGVSIIPIVSLFNDVIQLLQAQEEPGTISRTLKENYSITNPTAQVIGNVSVFLRLSCFGKLIVTQFQMNLEDKSVFFKDKEGKSLYKYRKASKEEAKQEQEKPGTSQGCKPLTAPQAVNDYSDGRCVDCSTGPAGNEGDYYPQDYGATQVQPYKSQLTEKGNYQEIGAEMNGNALTIRVHKNKGTVRRIDGNESDTFVNTQDKLNKGYHNDACVCLAEMPQARQPRNDCYCLKPASNFRGASCAEKQVLSLKPGSDPNNPFAFRVSGCPNSVNNNVTVVSPTSTRPDGMQVTEISDPNKDVFILRIGKKSEGADKKANLELELVTPKGIERKPVPKKETRETQYLASDAGPETGGKGKKGKGGKGKKGKGGKGKKGKGGKGKGKGGKGKGKKGKKK